MSEFSSWFYNADVAESYKNIGISYGQLGDHKQSLEYNRKSLAIRINLFGENHADVAESYMNIGISYGKLGNHKQSLEYKQKSLAIRIELFGENHADVADSYY
jgi:preprotein translocase subunit SecA/nephrocystin-3